MIGIAVLSAFIGVVAVSLECEVAALVSLGLAVDRAVSRVTSGAWARLVKNTCGATCEMSLLSCGSY